MWNIFCALTGHDFYVEEEFSLDERKVTCERCGKSWAMHDGFNAFVPWDSDFERLYADIKELKEKEQASYLKMLNGEWFKENRDKEE